jgi:hypothetical protein
VGVRKEAYHKIHTGNVNKAILFSVCASPGYLRRIISLGSYFPISAVNLPLSAKANVASSINHISGKAPTIDYAISWLTF